MTDSGSPNKRVYSERYEIQDKIARGGMADVFLARDQLLDRPVALKVLFPELSVDPTFVERFRREAQNAAKLSHPNIVSVYDWGEEGNTYFIVMEYVDGKSLSSILREQGALPVDQVARIGAEVASALSFAHRNGVVHRDVKPGNVLIDDRGSVKVTDFGIARARNTTENLTQTGAVMGTATYFSPEQAQGLEVDQRSDVYSLGVVLYEMATGKPPFQGDNPVTIAYKHVREQPPALREVNKAIPLDLAAVIMEALAKSAPNRYQTAEDLRADLIRFSNGQRVHATALAPSSDATRSTPPYRSPEQAYAESVRTIPATRVQTPPPRLPKDNTGLRGPLFFFLALLAVLGIAAIVLFTNNSLTSDEKKPVTIPAVTGKKLSDARSELSNLKLKTETSEEASDQPENTVLRQDPGATASAMEGDTVRLVISAGPAPITLTNYQGQSGDAAANALRALGLNVTTTQATSSSVEKGRVISQDPTSGSKISKGQTVTLTVSTGPQQVEVPNVVGFTQSTAAQELSDAGLRTTATNESSDQPSGTVIRSDPSAGTPVDKGTTVTITVSSGPAQTTSSTSTTSSTTTTTGKLKNPGNDN